MWPAQPVRLRPLGVGERIDAAIKIVRANFLTLAKASLVVAVPSGIVVAIISVSVRSSSEQPVLTGTTSSTIYPALGAELLTLVITLVVSALVTAVCFRVIANAYLGQRADWREALRFGWSRLLAVIWISLLTYRRGPDPRPSDRRPHRHHSGGAPRRAHGSVLRGARHRRLRGNNMVLDRVETGRAGPAARGRPGDQGNTPCAEALSRLLVVGIRHAVSRRPSRRCGERGRRPHYRCRFQRLPRDHDLLGHRRFPCPDDRLRGVRPLLRGNPGGSDHRPPCSKGGLRHRAALGADGYPVDGVRSLLHKTGARRRLRSGWLPAAGLPAAGLPAAGLPAAGLPAAGLPTAGLPAAGLPTAGLPTAGLPAAGLPAAGLPAAGLPTATESLVSARPQWLPAPAASSTAWLAASLRLAASTSTAG